MAKQIKRGDKVDFWIEVESIVLDGTMEGVRAGKGDEEPTVSVTREGWHYPIPVPLSHVTPK